MKVLITGATGMIGQEIVKRCHEKDITVNYLTTSKSKIKSTENYQGFYWNPETNDIDTACFKNVDAIIHLAGATVAKRWTKSYKKEILLSRTKSAEVLINALKGETHGIKQVISASGISIYPDSQTNYYEEDFKGKDSTFLANVVHAWEQAVDGFSKVNIPAAKIRIGLVLANQGGALQQMVKPIKLGVGAAFGTGKQWQSWIHIDDLANIFMHVLEHKLEGVYNAVSPNPVSNNELTKTIANILHKPLFLPNIPKFFMKLVLGEMHTILFDSQRVSSKKVEDSGFYFQHHHLKPALVDLLKS